MWQPDINPETASHPTGAAAPLTSSMSQQGYNPATEYPAGGVAPSSYALALYNYIHEVRVRLRRT